MLFGRQWSAVSSYGRLQPLMNFWIFVHSISTDTKFALIHDVAHTGEFVCVYGCRSSLHQSRRGICCRASAPQDDPLKACAHLVALARLIATILKKIRRLIPSNRTTP
ncbi:hypothetical protein PSTG_05973 [Puccinia striiformis f. sp. tritici PST-78]|uniref:Uncharacterized protein n=1 Tax=Puccinia striiformis f. sp. tritici PST-78 TaxID=1165861 RepID=A0A0L0VNI6_9BASI|nr:hypothetical protein PSTG_05973 [Puccinia striiformis f. sp. tritici PST-78]